MIWQKLLKYPVLVIGVILFGLFLADDNTRKWLKSEGEKRIPSTCRALKSRLESKVPPHWALNCQDKLTLTVELDYIQKKSLPLPIHGKLKNVAYRTLANDLHHFAKLSNPETLVRLARLQMVLRHPKIKIEAISDGESLVKLGKLESKQAISDHLRVSVKIREAR